MRPRPISWGGRWPNWTPAGRVGPAGASTVPNALGAVNGSLKVALPGVQLPVSGQQPALGRGAPKGTGRAEMAAADRKGAGREWRDLRPAKALTVRRRGGGAGVGLRRRQLPGGVDQRHMGESLRKIADQALALGVVLFR